MTIRTLLVPALVFTVLAAPNTFAQDATTDAVAQTQTGQFLSQESPQEIKNLTDIVMRDHVENLIEHNYWNATELYFSQRQDIDFTRTQFDALRAEMRQNIGEVYDGAMPPIHNLISAIFEPSEAMELTQTIESGGVSAALTTPLGQRFSSEAMPAINQVMDAIVFDQVYAGLPNYRVAAINRAIALGFLSADLAPEQDAEFDMGVQGPTPAPSE